MGWRSLLTPRSTSSSSMCVRRGRYNRKFYLVTPGSVNGSGMMGSVYVSGFMQEIFGIIPSTVILKSENEVSNHRID